MRLRVSSLIRDERTILRDLDWRVLSDEHWALLGPNGAGKTTILNVLAGYLWPSEGEVVVLGRRFGSYDLRELRKSIGIVSNAIARWLPGDTDVRTQVESAFEATIGRSWRPTTPLERSAALVALEAISAAHLVSQRYETLSQGEQQRVMIARALVAKPSLLLLDECCAGLDPVARRDLLRDIDRLGRQADAPRIVMVTHHLEELPACITHALAVRDGTALAQGPTAKVLTAGVMSELFGVPCDVASQPGSWRLEVR